MCLSGMVVAMGNSLPYGVVVDQQGNYVVADYNNHCIQIFNSKGEFVRKFGLMGRGKWSYVLSLWCWSSVEWKYCDSENRLQIFDSEGNFVRIVGAGRLEKSSHLFVDSDDNIIVADAGNQCIQVFHWNGNRIKTMGKGQVSIPRCVCMDREGRIIVSKGGRISIF